MKNLTVYLMFDGACEAAMNFYRDALRGEIVSLMRMGDSEMPVPDDFKNYIMHSVLQAGSICLMASDTMPQHPIVFGNNAHLSLDFDNADEQTAVFEHLASGGNVTMPLQDTFWGARFGTLTDQFGVCWMFNYDYPKA